MESKAKPGKAALSERVRTLVARSRAVAEYFTTSERMAIDGRLDDADLTSWEDE